MSRDKVITADAAAELVLAGDTLATTGFVGTGFPEELALALERRFLDSGEPRDLTLATFPNPKSCQLLDAGIRHEATCGSWRTRPSLEDVATGGRGMAATVSDNERTAMQLHIDGRGVSVSAGAFDVLTMGQMGVDNYPAAGRGVATARGVVRQVPANVAVAAARLERRSVVISRTGADPFGEFLHDALQGFGVDDRFVTPVPDLPTPVTFCEIFPPDDFPLYFYRRPSAPDMQINADELDLDAIRDANIFWVTVTGLSEEPSREATLAALRARAGRGYTVLDLDYRPMFWPTREEARKYIQEALPYVDVAVGNLEECETAVGEREPYAAARALHERGVSLAIVKRGPAGVLAHDGLTHVEVPPVPVEVVNGLGAGDAFGGALCHALLAGWDLERSMRFCNAAGAIVASRLACADAMPTADEVEAKLEEAKRA